MDSLIALVEGLPIVFWEVFFLVPMGRGKDLPMLNAPKFDEAFEKLYALSKRAKFILKVTEAPHYRMFCIEKDLKKSAEDAGQTPNKDVCGGSRARAYAVTGDFLAEDPCCSYIPAAIAS